MRTQKVVALMLVAAMSMALAACGSSGSGSGGSTETTAAAAEDSAEDEAEAPAPSGDRITLKLTMTNSAASVCGRAGTFWSEEIEEAYQNGETDLELLVYPNGQLGTVNEIYEQITMGEPLLIATDAGELMSFDENLAILQAPYFLENEDEAYLVFETPWIEEQKQVLEENGIKALTCDMIYGSRHIMATAPIREPADMQGLKIRTPSSEITVALIEAMGATATPLPLSDVYASIQQGIVDGMENPFATHIDNSMYEVCDYLSLTGHQITINWFVMSADVFNSLSERDQEVLLATAADAAEYYNEINVIENEEALQTLIDKGVTVIDDVDIAAFKEATNSVYDDFGYTDIRKEIYEQMDELR